MQTAISSTPILNGTFYFDPKDRIYADHFQGHPVVPGSIIIHAFIQAARILHKSGRIRAINKFRFKKFIGPGEYAYRIEASGPAVKCSLFDDHGTVAMGTLML